MVATEVHRQASDPVRGSARRILVVDDEAPARAAFERLLSAERRRRDQTSLAFDIDTAPNGLLAISRVAESTRESRPYALAFVDVHLESTPDGPETIEQIWAIDSDIEVVVCSGASDIDWSDLQGRFQESSQLLILRKPFDPLEVVQLSHALTSKWMNRRQSRLRTSQLEKNVRDVQLDLEDAQAKLARESAQRLQLEAEHRLAQKLEAIGQLAAGIAHEINTPTQYASDNVHFLRSSFDEIEGLRRSMREMFTQLAEASGRTDAVQKLEALEAEIDLDYLSTRIPKACESAKEGLRRIATIVQAMKEFGHQDNGQKRSVDLNRAIQTTLEVSRNEYKYVADVEADLGELPLVSCLAGEMNQVFLNLIVNAAHAIAEVVGNSGKKGTIRVATRKLDDDVQIEIRDSGCGIPDSIKHRVYDPFFTTKDVGRGTGQGLAIARSIIVDKHGGTISFESKVGIGSTFRVRIPICPLDEAKP